MHARSEILARIAALDGKIRAVAKQHGTVRLLMTAPGVGPITAMAVTAAFDDAERFNRSSSAGAYLGLTPRRYESGENQPERGASRKKRVTGSLEKCLYESSKCDLVSKAWRPSPA
ncbi:transposase [Sphingobium sp. Ant17]|uniref:transposase n=1 Tax=Sphingobium sp. Ant17 TaxID=1461752 RepID=UPI00190F1825|nr:transposase [Sphingobium sp. Ant17]